MTKTSFAICAIVAGVFLRQVANADETALRALLQVDAYDRKVEVHVNGVRLVNITGGSSQTIQLLHKDSPDKSDFPEHMRCLCCLRAGTNTIAVSYSTEQAETPRAMEITIRAATPTADGRMKASATNAFERKIEGSDKAGKFTATFGLGIKSSAEQKTR